MKSIPTGLLALTICFTAGAVDISDSLKTIRAVGPE